MFSSPIVGCGTDATGTSDELPSTPSTDDGGVVGTTTETAMSVPEWVRDSDADYHVDLEDGDNANARPRSNGPFADLQPFESEVSLDPGDTVEIRGGVYKHSSDIDLSGTTGTSDSPVVLEPYRNEKPVLDFKENNGHGVVLDHAQHVTVRGLEIRNADKHNVRVKGNEFGNAGPQNAVDVVIEDCAIHGHGAGGRFGHGILAAFGADRTVVHRCELFDGTSGGNSDGLHLSNGVRNTVIERTVCHHNSDDGVDFGAGNSHDPTSPALLRYVVCYRNGTNLSETATGDGTGFKTGDCEHPAGGHRFVRCIAFDNEGRGFGGPCTDVPIRLHNCTALDNRIANVHVTAHAAHEVVNCVAQGSEGSDLFLSPETDVRHCNWDESLRGQFDALDAGGVEVFFQSTDPESVDFLRPWKYTSAVDAGAKIGVGYAGDAPDWGAFEFRPNGGCETTQRNQHSPVPQGLLARCTVSKSNRSPQIVAVAKD